MSLDEKIQNYNLTKEIVVTRLVKEGYMSEEEGVEFCTRIQVIVFKPKWFKRWFQKNWPKITDMDGEYLKVIEVEEKSTSFDDLIHRTAQKT